MLTKEQTEKLQLILRITEHDETSKTIAELCKEIMRIDVMNEKSKSSKFDIFKYVSKELKRIPAVCGVYHHHGDMVASDCQILVTLKNQSYDPELENQIVYKNGVIFKNYKYPDYESIHPHNNQVAYKFDFTRFDAIVKEDNLKKKMLEKWELANHKPTIKVGWVVFKLENMKRLVDFMKHIGTDEILFAGEEPNRHSALVENEKGWGVVMPYRLDDVTYTM